MNTNQLLSDYRNYLQAQDKSRYTIQNFSDDIRKCFEFLENQGISDIATVLSADIECFLVAIATLPDGRIKNSNTMNRKKVAIRSFFAWAYRTGIIPSDPANHLRTKRVDQLPPTYLTADEEKRLLDCLANRSKEPHRQRDTAIIRLLLDTGIRVGELVQIELSDIDGKHLIIRRAKGGSPIRKFLPSITRQVISEYIDGERSRYVSQSESTALFLTQTRERMHPRAVQIVTQKWVRLAGIEKPITPHKLRHTFATSLYAKSHDILAVQKALGHRSIVHTQIYAHISDESLETVLESRASEFQL